MYIYVLYLHESVKKWSTKCMSVKKWSVIFMCLLKNKIWSASFLADPCIPLLLCGCLPALAIPWLRPTVTAWLGCKHLPQAQGLAHHADIPWFAVQTAFLLPVLAQTSLSVVIKRSGLTTVWEAPSASKYKQTLDSDSQSQYEYEEIS